MFCERDKLNLIKITDYNHHFNVVLTDNCTEHFLGFRQRQKEKGETTAVFLHPKVIHLRILVLIWVFENLSAAYLIPTSHPNQNVQKYG